MVGRFRLTQRSTDFGFTSVYAARASQVHPPAAIAALSLSFCMQPPRQRRSKGRFTASGTSRGARWAWFLRLREARNHGRHTPSRCPGPRVPRGCDNAVEERWHHAIHRPGARASTPGQDDDQGLHRQSRGCRERTTCHGDRAVRRRTGAVTAGACSAPAVSLPSVPRGWGGGPVTVSRSANDNAGQHAVRVQSMRQCALRLLDGAAPLPGPAEVQVLTLRLRGYLQLLIPEVDDTGSVRNERAHVHCLAKRRLAV
ncbi:DUF6415 family natural product biosynthesis protein [Streptomyces sp. NPDC047017]|uniref:DUF6415 family natural product biosynthesis protein n=1 Tax=Streptomyces sp. NPDC047017 TaxID=3155024 RepID=UPI0033E3D041